MQDQWQGFHHHDESERRKWQDPETILREIGLKSGDTFVDTGCGNGFFTLPAARIVGPEGTVIGIDIDRAAVDELRSKAANEGLANLELHLGEGEGAVLCERCADFVFFGIDLHDFRDPALVLDNSLKMIKSSGLLVDLDWKDEETPLGPPLEKRLSASAATTMIQRAGYIIVDVRDSGPYHYIILARPAGGTQS